MSNRKKQFLITFACVVMAVTVCSTYYNLASATEITYTPLTSIDPTSNTKTAGTASAYIARFYTSFLALVVVMALLMVTKGGIKLMMSGDNASKRTEAKDDIYQALLGLVLAMSTYLILNILNPRTLPTSGNLFNHPVTNKEQT